MIVRSFLLLHTKAFLHIRLAASKMTSIVRDVLIHGHRYGSVVELSVVTKPIRFVMQRKFPNPVSCAAAICGATSFCSNVFDH